jgi:predicted RNA-binding protein with PUA domain
VSPVGTNFAEKFGTAFKALCKKTNVLLAENCPKNEKAFELQKTGIVLGIGFKSKSQEWFLKRKKSEKN